MIKNILKIITPFLILAIFFSGCSTSDKESTTNKISIYTTIFPLEDFAKTIGGEYVEVTSVYPPGVDSHSYEPTQKTVVDVAKSNMFIYSGTGLEVFVDKMTKALKDEKVSLINASENITLLKPDPHDHEADEHGDFDPHAWLDPILSIQMAENIKNALVAAQPEHKDYFEKNYLQVKNKLTDLDAQFKDLVAHAKRKEILVSHAAYGYWEHRYGITQVSVTGISPSQEPSQKQLADLMKTVKEHKLNTILFETFATPKVAEVVQNELGITSLRLNHMATISDEDAKSNKTYFDLMEENLQTLKKVMN